MEHRTIREHLIRCAAVVLLSLLLRSGVVLGGEFAENPLRPPDTSSPRDTLRGFLSHMDDIYFALKKANAETAQVAGGLRDRAVQMLDFSETTNGGTWDEQNNRLIYLKEILDRVPLPSWQEIPGDREVAEGEISKWTIPDTRIAIVRVKEGERAGEYLFSPESVARLHRYYRQTAHLPYKPGATEGFFENFTQHTLTEGTIASRIRSRLKPIDASNPRELLQQFLASVNAAYALMMEADAALRTKPPTMTWEAALEAERKAGVLIGRAVSALDLSEVPEALRDRIGVETALLLKEIFDRAPLQPVAAIPDVRAVEALREAGKQPIRWSLPNTQIEIAELTEGPYAGEFRFSARTVARADEYYEKVRDLSYRAKGQYSADSRFSEEYDSPQVSEGIYEYYISTPGFLIPGVSWLGPLLTDLPDPLKKIYLGQTVWQWLGIALGVLVAVLGFALVYATGWLAEKHVAAAWTQWIKVLIPVVNTLIVFQLVHFIDSGLNATGSMLGAVVAVGTALVYLFAAGAAYRVCLAVTETVVAAVRPKDVDASLARVGASVVGFVAAAFIVVHGVQQVGLNLVPLIAGLGVGGLAVALAVRPTLENMIGGLILYADKPISVGDYCSFGGHSGTVERIGLRSTRIRALDRTLITIPNSVFADMQLINWARCDKMMISTVIGLRYETTPDQLRHVLARMRQLCFAHPKVETETLRIRFSGFGATSLDVSVRVYALTNEWNEFYAIREDLYLRFAETIEESGTSVAVPARTLYVSRDDGLDPGKVDAAEREVASWRSAGELPFPFIPEPLATQITDSLDYPPKGSPQAGGKPAVSASEEPLSNPEESGEEPGEDNAEKKEEQKSS